MKDNNSSPKPSLEDTRRDFIVQWGALGSQWGINRTMAQIHALLMTATGPMSTDEVMEELQISRGNAHTNIKELVSWGLLRSIVRIGERKEYFEAEKDVWKIFTMVARERKRRELDPALEVLRQCRADSKGIKTAEGKAFHNQLKELEEFVNLASTLADKVSSMNHSFAIKMATKLLG
ncbi:MAG: transcriptional regulator [Akkermansiaceae bacterium]|nr:transcriptional regulator [Akkermansiaceae bacterium]